ncbi:hypothetical protein V1264_020094 [Littorina saxatilis]|uniref:Cadherin domain-containing protein n=2 Tax=Littorina saxatilis TaxID=31220 RepID=A0AAN9GAI0_9CAEN
MQPQQLMLRARELSISAFRTADLNITINIVDSNDHPPKCADYVIFLTLPEDAAPGTVLTSLNCSDIDVSDRLEYTIASDSSNRFAVNSSTGEVSVARFMDFETEDHNTDVIVYVHDVSSTPFTMTVLINLLITDVDDNAPQFSSDVINIEIPEDTDLGRLVGTLTTTDADSPGTPLSKPTYGFVPATHSSFYIHPDTGTILTNALLDREFSENIQLTVSAHSSNRTTNVSTALVNITIIDINDNPPVFTPTFLMCNVSEGASKGTPVCAVTASDVDTGTFADITYSSDSSLFPIHSISGEMSLNGTLDYEQQTSYTLVVTATDDPTAKPPSQRMTSHVLVRVQVEGVNEATPVWRIPANDSEIRYVPENTMPGTSLFTLSASDDDTGDDGQVTYQLLQPAASPFLLHAQQGVVTLRSKLDRETLDIYVLVLEACDSAEVDQRSSTVTFTISVLDINDNAPVCKHVEPVIVSSSASIGDSMLNLSCSDLDLTNGVMTYVKTGGDVSGVFSVNLVSGEIGLSRLPTQAQYEVRVEVFDGGPKRLSTYTTVTFIIEDVFLFANLPAVLRIHEDDAVGSILLDIETVGSNLPTFFELAGGEGVFAVQPSTGEIILMSALDREARDTYEVTVVAYTAIGQRATSSVTLSVQDVNDNAPILSGTFNFSVSENVSVPRELHVFSAIDVDLGDNGTVVFRITSGNDGQVFSLTSDGKLSAVAPLDAEQSRLHQLVIEAKDGGIPSLTSHKHVYISVKEVDEHQPEFITTGQSLHVSIPEDTTVGAPVIHLQAEDADLNDDVKFDFISGNVEDTFVIDRATGRLYLSRVLDRETHSTFELVIQASNARQKTTNTTVTLTVTDANDNAPVFSRPHYRFEVDENAAPGTSTCQIRATDSDLGPNGEFYLEITEGDSDHVFLFDGLNLVINKSLNASVSSSFTLTVRATDRGTPVLSSDVAVLVTVTPENKPPKFLLRDVNFTVPENSLTGIMIYDFEATFGGARETGDLVYAITSGNDADRFSLDQYSGQLYLIRDLDFEKEHSVTITVRAEHAKDSALSDVITFTVYVTNVNDVTPAFLRSYTWSVPEGGHTATSLGRVSATDRDEGDFGLLAYSITGDSRFSIDETTGEVTLTGQISYSDNTFFSLSVIATDQAGPNSLTGSVTVTVHVTEVNDHVPSFQHVAQEVSIPESSVVGSVVTVLLPRDDDLQDNGKVTCDIIGGNQAGKFSIDPVICVVNTTASLDAESQSTYILMVTATDHGTPSLTGTMTLTVSVSDDNDNAPVFDPDTAHVHLSRADPPSTLVYTATATDADSGSNGLVLYSFLSGNAAGHFTLDPQSGRVQTISPLDLAADNHTLLLTATDLGYPANVALLTLHIDISSSLTPSTVDQTFTVMENSAVGTVVGTLPSERSKTTLSHRIASGNYRAAFSITTDAGGDGVIRLEGPVDREEFSEYQLAVVTERADDNVTTVVRVEVVDINDNAPEFLISSLAFPVVENLPPGTTLGTLSVIDKDTGTNADLTLSFESTTPLCDVYFSLNYNGVITVKHSVDYEALRELICEVVAKDDGSPALTSTATFTASVIDVDENLKIVNGSNSTVFLSLEIPFDSSTGILVHTLTPSEFSMTTTPADTLRFLSGSENGVFSVSTTTGEVSVGRHDLLYDNSRYFQWVVCHHEMGEARDTQLGMVRVDTFSMNRHVVVISYAVSKEYLEANRSSLKAHVQVFFPGDRRVGILEIRDDTPPNTRRRLLSQQSVVMMYVVNDTAADSVGGVDRAKVFLSQADVLKVLQQSPDGTPVSGLSDALFPVIQVMPYHKSLVIEAHSESLLDTGGGLSLVICAILLCAAIALFLCVCCVWKRQKRTNRTRESTLSLLGSGEEIVVTDRRTSMDIKQELDSMLPLPFLLTHSLQLNIQTPPDATHMANNREQQIHVNRSVEEKKRKKKTKKAGKVHREGSDLLLIAESLAPARNAGRVELLQNVAIDELCLSSESEDEQSFSVASADNASADDTQDRNVDADGIPLEELPAEPGKSRTTTRSSETKPNIFLTVLAAIRIKLNTKLASPPERSKNNASNPSDGAF